LQNKQQNCYQTKKSFLKKNRNKKMKKHKAKKGFKKNRIFFFFLVFNCKRVPQPTQGVGLRVVPWHMKQNNININNAME